MTAKRADGRKCNNQQMLDNQQMQNDQQFQQQQQQMINDMNNHQARRAGSPHI
jgi:hypothetical protein